MEQPGQKTPGRSPQATRAAPVSQGRPLSADDIQKAKMRAQYMQSKYGRTSSSNESKEAKAEALNKSSTSHASVPSPSKISFQPNIEEQKKPVSVSSDSNKLEASLDQKLRMNSKEPLSEKCKRVSISWHSPPGTFAFGCWVLWPFPINITAELLPGDHKGKKKIIFLDSQDFSHGESILSCFYIICGRRSGLLPCNSRC